MNVAQLAASWKGSPVGVWSRLLGVRDGELSEELLQALEVCAALTAYRLVVLTNDTVACAVLDALHEWAHLTAARRQVAVVNGRMLLLQAESAPGSINTRAVDTVTGLTEPAPAQAAPVYTTVLNLRALRARTLASQAGDPVAEDLPAPESLH